MGLQPLMTQLMRFNDCSLIVLDLKADDQTVFKNIEHEANEWTNRQQKHTTAFDGLRASAIARPLDLILFWRVCRSLRWTKNPTS